MRYVLNQEEVSKILVEHMREATNNYELKEELVRWSAFDDTNVDFKTLECHFYDK